MNTGPILDSNGKVAVIAGAGPAGLTAALELLRRSEVTPIVFEADLQVGGISKTVEYRGNRMDLGGHRFFSKSDWVMRWWQDILPVADGQVDFGVPLRLSYQQQRGEFTPTALGAAKSDAVMLVRERLSRIFYQRRFFDYPLKLNINTFRGLGLLETLRIGLSYSHARLIPRKPEHTLEDFFINRFGDRLYRTFFKDYTEKVWGVPCEEISAEWGAQRIKGLSITKAVTNAVTSRFRSSAYAAQKRSETSLIERFLYPKFGPGQLWEEVARRVQLQGGAVHLRHRVIAIERNGLKITAAVVRDELSGCVKRVPCEYFISTMPVSDLTAMLKPEDPGVTRVAGRLPYRDFITVGLLLSQMNGGTGRAEGENPSMPRDNWIYIQERDVKIGRLQIFNNWSPAMVGNPDSIWLGLEYFCRQGDALWSMENSQLVDFAARELEKIGMIRLEDVLDGTVVRVARAYPAYFGEYSQFGLVRAYLDSVVNLYPIGRNGMHRYNNQDHSMLAADAAVKSIVANGAGKSEIWNINAESDYHEEMNEPQG
jgi:protoporphyrinogen oxidase